MAILASCYHIKIKLCRPVIFIKLYKSKTNILDSADQNYGQILNTGTVPYPTGTVFRIRFIRFISVIDPNYSFSFHTNNVQKGQVLMQE
jgi:hypothetical protein